MPWNILFIIYFFCVQNGSKESTPDVCPEYRRGEADSCDDSATNSETECPEPAPSPAPAPDTATNGHVINGLSGGGLRPERKTNQIESSTDTLVPDSDTSTPLNGIEVRQSGQTY